MKTKVYNHHHVINHDFDTVVHEQDAELSIFWNDFHFDKQVRNAARRGKTLLYQHGRYALQDYYMNDKPITTHGVLTWGEAQRQKMIEWGYDADKILAVGNPMYEQRYKSDVNDYVVFVAAHWLHDIGSLNSNIIEMIHERLPEDTRLIVKTMRKTKLSRELPEGVERYETNVDQPDNEGIAALVSGAQVVFTLMESTFELFARLAGTPVVQIENSLMGRMHGKVDIAGIQRPYTTLIHPRDIGDAILNANVTSGWEDEILMPHLPVEEIYKFVRGL